MQNCSKLLMSKVSKLSGKDDNLPSKPGRSDRMIGPPELPYLPVDVQHSDESVLPPGDLQRSVYPGYDAVKQVGVELLGQGISGI